MQQHAGRRTARRSYPSVASAAATDAAAAGYDDDDARTIAPNGVEWAGVDARALTVCVCV